MPSGISGLYLVESVDYTRGIILMRSDRKRRNIFRDFLPSNALEALSYKGLFFGEIMAKGEKGNPEKAIPIRLAIAFLGVAEIRNDRFNY